MKTAKGRPTPVYFAGCNERSAKNLKKNQLQVSRSGHGDHFRVQGNETIADWQTPSRAKTYSLEPTINIGCRIPSAIFEFSVFTEETNAVPRHSPPKLVSWGAGLA